MKNSFRDFFFAASLILLTSCTAILVKEWDSKYGKADATKFDFAPVPRPLDVTYRDVAHVFEARCTVCHSCYDAPCQLKFTAWEGIARGASTDRVYDGSRLKAVPTTRLFEDAFMASEWRELGFHPVLNERPGQDNIDGSLIGQMLLLKQKNPTPECRVLPKTFDVSIDRNQQCNSIENFSSYSSGTPLWGMPFGLPELKTEERNLVLNWIRQGAPREPLPATPANLENQVLGFENWLNADGFKAQLVARYIYEHLFLAHLHFGDDRHFFRIVRSRTPTGKAIDLIATRRPYDDPGVPRPYYRIIPLTETVVKKSHMPYRLDQNHFRLWQKWFVDAPFEVKKMPTYDPEQAANPFVTFVDIPVGSRYRFMLEEAQFTIMGFIKGPVCRGQLALDVINSHFWVFFANPASLDETDQAQFLAENSQNLRLPSELESNAPILSHWQTYAKGQRSYLEARANFVKNRKDQSARPGLQKIWSGKDEFGQNNPNAALTIFRHFDNASVEKGLLGNLPETAWIINYPLLERIHYLLVAGYDVYGNIGHQLKSRLYMDFLRIEGEQNFLSFLPEKAHLAIERRWYRGAPASTMDYVTASHLPLNAKAQIGLEELENLPPQNAYEQLLDRFRKRVASSLVHDFDLQGTPVTAPWAELKKMSVLNGKTLQWLPQDILLKLVLKNGASVWLSLINNSAYKNVAQLFFEDHRRLPDEDTLTMVNGFLGAYPNALWSVHEEQLPELTQSISTLRSEADYSALLDRFGVRRTNASFWELSDEAHQAMKNQQGVNFGLLDYNRLENR